MVGCPRSGTTLVQSILAASGELTSFPEGHFFSKGFPGFPRFRPRDLSSVRWALYSSLLGSLPEDERREVTRSVSWDPDHSAATLISTLDAIAAARGAKGWVEKTPDHVFRIHLIKGVAPDVHIVHVLRGPEATISSLHRASRRWDVPRTWMRSTLHWQFASAASRRWLGSPGHHMVRYEDLVGDPERVSRGLYQKLGLAWTPDVLARRVDVARLVVSTGEDWKQRNFQGSVEDTGVTSAPLGVRAMLAVWNPLRRLNGEGV